MAHFEIPEPRKFDYLDLNDLKGLDSYSMNPNYMRSSDMLNMIKKDGLHRVRPSVKQRLCVFPEPNKFIPFTDEDYEIKYIGKVEEIENGNTVPYYIKISEKMGKKDAKNESKICISCWASPKVGVAGLQDTMTPGLEKYSSTYKLLTFTNMGKTGNRSGLYETIMYDDKEWVFTPIGIITFKCRTDKIEGLNEKYETIELKQLNFDIINVLDNPYVPNIVINSNPDGTGFTKYEPVNLLTDKRKVSFLSDGTSTVYKLPEKSLFVNSAIVKILNDKGGYDEITDFIFDEIKGEITFSKPPIKSYVDGKDNIIVEYQKQLIKSEPESVTIISETLNKKLKTVCVLSKNTKGKIDIKTTYTLGSGYTKEDVLKNLTLYINTNGLDLHQKYDDSVIDMLIRDGTFTSNTRDVDLVTLTQDWYVKTVIEYDTNSTQTTESKGSSEEDLLIDTKDIPVVLDSQPTDKIHFDFYGSLNAYVGSHVDGSDSYWLIDFLPTLTLINSTDVILPNKKIFAYINGIKYEVGETGVMNGQHTRYPYAGNSFVCKIPYSDLLNGTEISFETYVEVNDNIFGKHVDKIQSVSKTYKLPAITLPIVEYTPGKLFTVTELGLGKYSIPKDDINIQNKINARLMCYYNCKSACVYGYEADRRIFVTDGSAVDTFSGITSNGQSSIYYFPDDNYRQLGEDTEILGYAQSDNLLYTFKRGEDSLHIRYGTTINKVVQFPSSYVMKNLQILSKPIQVCNEILVITRNGIVSVAYYNNECKTYLRSYFINNYFELNADYDYDKMQYYVEDNLLTIFLDNKSFTTDLTLKSYVKEGNTPGRNSGTSTLSYQYDWYVCEYEKVNKGNPPLVKIYQPKDFERYDYNISYKGLQLWGYSTTGVYEFKWDGNKVDEIFKPMSDGSYYAYFIPIPAHYITPFMNFGVINVAKTIRYLYINSRANNGYFYEIGYIDEEGEEVVLDKIYSDINDTLTKYRNEMIPFPKLIQIKSKIKKFMNIKLFIRNLAEQEKINPPVEKDNLNKGAARFDKYKDMNFDRIVIQYHVAGKYRGE